MSNSQEYLNYLLDKKERFTEIDLFFYISVFAAGIGLMIYHPVRSLSIAINTEEQILYVLAFIIKYGIWLLFLFLITMNRIYSRSVYDLKFALNDHTWEDYLDRQESLFKSIIRLEEEWVKLFIGALLVFIIVSAFELGCFILTGYIFEYLWLFLTKFFVVVITLLLCIKSCRKRIKGAKVLLEEFEGFYEYSVYRDVNYRFMIIREYQRREYMGPLKKFMINWERRRGLKKKDNTTQEQPE
ncbi:MAG: hypothetical protein V2B15_03620 [Bacteroidota bacterium]